MDTFMYIEGGSLLIAGMALLYVIKKRGRDRTMLFLAIFFILAAIFRIGSTFTMPAGIEKTLMMVGLVLSNGCLYVGLAVYAGFQARLLGRPGLSRATVVCGLIVAVLATGIHAIATAILPVSERVMIIVRDNQLRIMLSIFVIYAVYFVCLSIGIAIMTRRSSGGRYRTIALSGIGILLLSWVLQKIVQVGSFPGSTVLLPILPFVAIAIVIIAVFLETRRAQAPAAVFDAFTGAPVPLAVVRVYAKEHDKLIETRVTGDDGHFVILLEPGEYRMDVMAQGYQFPTQKKKGYIGTVFRLNHPELVNFSIYLDPVAGS